MRLIPLLALIYLMAPLTFQISAKTFGNGGAWKEQARTLGALSWQVGAPLLLLFVVYKQVAVGLMRRGIMPPIPPRWAIKAHMIVGLSFGALSLLHGLLMGEPSSLELLMLTLVALLMVNGVLLKVKRGKGVHSKLIWAQRGMSAVLLVATLVHVSAWP